MEKVEKEDPQYRETETQVLHLTEEVWRESLEILRSHYNQNKSLHTLQGKYGCNISAEGRKSGFNLYGYDGKTFITFNTENLTWVALDPQAQVIQRKWDADPGYNQRKKAYLEEKCIEWLDKYLSYQKEPLQRTEPPVVTMSSRTEVEDGMETHVCRVHGFYPREIDASWTRDREVWLQDTFRGFLTPNADGTYYYWISIQIDPKERGRYRCHVEHDGLQNPLDLELKEPTTSEPTTSEPTTSEPTTSEPTTSEPTNSEPTNPEPTNSESTNSKSNLWLIIIGCVVAALILLCGIAGIVVFFKRRQVIDGRSHSSEQEMQTKQPN